MPLVPSVTTTRNPLYREQPPERQPDQFKGQIWMAPDFDETPQDVIDSFYSDP